MCGIVGYIGTGAKASEVLVEEVELVVEKVEMG